MWARSHRMHVCGLNEMPMPSPQSGSCDCCTKCVCTHLAQCWPTLYTHRAGGSSDHAVSVLGFHMSAALLPPALPQPERGVSRPPCHFKAWDHRRCSELLLQGHLQWCPCEETLDTLLICAAHLMPRRGCTHTRQATLHPILFCDTGTKTELLHRAEDSAKPWKGKWNSVNSTSLGHDRKEKRRPTRWTAAAPLTGKWPSQTGSSTLRLSSGAGAQLWFWTHLANVRAWLAVCTHAACQDTLSPCSSALSRGAHSTH